MLKLPFKYRSFFTLYPDRNAVKRKLLGKIKNKKQDMNFAEKRFHFLDHVLTKMR